MEIDLKIKIHPEFEEFCNNDATGPAYKKCRFLHATAPYCRLFDCKLKSDGWQDYRCDECINSILTIKIP